MTLEDDRRRSLELIRAGSSCNAAAQVVGRSVSSVIKWARLEGIDTSKRHPRPRPTCSIDGCDRPHEARGLCRPHYNVARERAKTRTCEVCLRPYSTSRWDGRVCSSECRWFISPNVQKSSDVVYRACSLCGITRTRQSMDGDYCSRLCAVASDLRRRLRLLVVRCCAECEDVFTVDRHEAPRSARTVYCSVPCRTRSRKRRWRERGHKAAAKQRHRARKKAATVERFSVREIYERDGWICGICDEPVPRRRSSSTDPDSPTLDHIVPLARGGAHSRANVQIAHRICNALKGDRDVRKIIRRGSPDARRGVG